MGELTGVVVCFAATAGLGLLLVVLLVRQHRRRVATLRAWAHARGWSYQKSDRGLVKRFKGEPFGKGYSRQARHVLSGEHRGRHVLGFEYRYTVSKGHDNGSTTYRYTVVAVTMPASRPYLQVGHEHLGHRLLDLVGIRDLQLESEEFNRVFRISTEDRKFAYDILHPRMMQWLLDDERARTQPFRLEDNAAVCWMAGTLEPENVSWMADYLVDILEWVPGYVWK